MTSRCILGFGVVWERDWTALQQVVDDTPSARRYFNSAPVALGKSQTFSVEGDNAQLRQYLIFILCKEKKQIVAEYALRNTATPIGIAQYTITEALPDTLKDSLPTAAQLEAELAKLSTRAPEDGDLRPF